MGDIAQVALGEVNAQTADKGLGDQHQQIEGVQSSEATEGDLHAEVRRGGQVNRQVEEKELPEEGVIDEDYLEEVDIAP